MDVSTEPAATPPDPPVLVSDASPWERLDPRYLTMRRLSRAAWSTTVALFWLGMFIALAWLSPMPPRYRVPLFLVWAIAATAHVVWSQYKVGLAYRYSAFRLDDDGIEIRRGAFFRSITSVPRSRVQHTDVSQGPFERRYGLGTLLIYTAGVSHAVIPLSGLAHPRALEIRDALLPRARVTRS